MGRPSADEDSSDDEEDAPKLRVKSQKLSRALSGRPPKKSAARRALAARAPAPRDARVGRWVEVYWAGDGAWYLGRVAGQRTRSGRLELKIAYADGETIHQALQVGAFAGDGLPRWTPDGEPDPWRYASPPARAPPAGSDALRRLASLAPRPGPSRLERLARAAAEAASGGDVSSEPPAAEAAAAPFAVGALVVDVDTPYHTLRVVAVAGDAYTLCYHDAGAWQGQKVSRRRQSLVAFGAALPRRRRAPPPAPLTVEKDAIAAAPSASARDRGSRPRDRALEALTRTQLRRIMARRGVGRGPRDRKEDFIEMREAAPSEAPAPPQTVGDLKRIFSLAAAKEVPPAPAAEEPRAASKAPPAGGSKSDESDDDVVPGARFDPALTALAEACNAFDQTRVATQSCTYKFTTVLLKTSTHLVGKSWAEFHAYVKRHGVRWSVRRRVITATREGTAYSVDLSFDPHAIVAADRPEAVSNEHERVQEDEVGEDVNEVARAAATWTKWRAGFEGAPPPPADDDDDDASAPVPEEAASGAPPRGRLLDEADLAALPGRYAREQAAAPPPAPAGRNDNMAATSAKQVETAKKTAECVWVVEHATRCPDNGCGVAGCCKAKKALKCLATRTVEASVSVSDIDAVRSVLQHRALCPWARPRGACGAAPSSEPCLVCVLASRARCVASDDGLVLDFSKRSPNDAGCFTAPRARAAEEEAAGAPPRGRLLDEADLAALPGRYAREQAAEAAAPPPTPADTPAVAGGGNEWRTEGHSLIGRDIIRLVEGGLGYSEGKVMGWLSAAESEFLDEKGQPAALFHVQYTAGALVGDEEDLELHEVQASIKVPDDDALEGLEGDALEGLELWPGARLGATASSFADQGFTSLDYVRIARALGKFFPGLRAHHLLRFRSVDELMAGYGLPAIRLPSDRVIRASVAATMKCLVSHVSRADDAPSVAAFAWAARSDGDTEAVRQISRLGVDMVAKVVNDALRPAPQTDDAVEPPPLQKNKKAHTDTWTEAEDDAVRAAVASYGKKAWTDVARDVNGAFPGRPKTGKQCRQRWVASLDPKITTHPWTEDEERIIRQSQAEVGNKWATIAKRLPGRTDNAVKNYWYSQKRKVARDKARAPKPKRRKVPVVGATEGASPAAAARPAVSGAVPVDDEPSDERAAIAPMSMLTPTLPAPPPPTS